MTPSIRTLRVLPDLFAVVRLDPGEATPAWARGAFCSVTRTPRELSIVCPEAGVPPSARAERGWRCLEVAGPIPFTEVGVLSSLASPLAAADISLFSVSTHDTDYLLVPAAHLDAARLALQAAGHVVTGA